MSAQEDIQSCLEIIYKWENAINKMGDDLQIQLKINANFNSCKYFIFKKNCKKKLEK